MGAMGKKRRPEKGIAVVCMGAGPCAILSKVNQSNLTEMVWWSKDEGDEGTKHEDVWGRASQAEGGTV